MRYTPGQQVEVRTAYGDWVVAEAHSDRFLNRNYVDRKTTPWMVVRVSIRGGETVNWPEADVRPLVPSPTS